jgi:hypothetical protein
VGSSTSSSSGGGGGAGGGTSAYEQLILGDGPVGYWRLGETSGVMARDKLVLHDGMYEGGYGLKQPGAIPGDPDAAAHFNGADTSVRIGDFFDFAGKASFTIEAWVKPDYLGSSPRRIVSKEDPNSAAGRQGYLLYARGTMLPNTGFERWVDDKKSEVFTDTALTLDVYNHVVVTYDGMSLVLYVNNQKMATQGTTDSLVDHAGSFAWGGGSDPIFEGGGHISATLDEVVVYDKALSWAQIEAHYKAVTGP